jgi:hypothetical protein
LDFITFDSASPAFEDVVGVQLQVCRMRVGTRGLLIQGDIDMVITTAGGRCKVTR